MFLRRYCFSGSEKVLVCLKEVVFVSLSCFIETEPEAEVQAMIGFESTVVMFEAVEERSVHRDRL